MKKINLLYTLRARRENKWQFQINRWIYNTVNRTIGSGYVMATLAVIISVGAIAYAESDHTYTVDKLECGDRTVVGWVSKNDMLYSYRVGDVEKSVPMVNCTRSINAVEARKSEMYERMKTQTPIGTHEPKLDM